MDERFTALEEIALAARAKKGRMDAASREKASELLASILADETVDPTPSLQLLDDIKAEAISEAIRNCWSKMDIARRNAFRRWVPAPSTERSYRRLAFLAAAVLESDGSTALEWLGLLIPPGRKNLGKESRETLASVLFGETVLSFDSLVRGAANPSELLRICATLFDIAADPTLAVSVMKRARLASGVLDFLSRTEAPQYGLAVSELRALIVADAKKWPPDLRNRVMPASGEAPASTLNPTPIGSPTSAKPPSETAATSEPATPAVVVGSLHDELPRLEVELNNRISAISRELGLLSRAHERISQLVQVAEHVEEQQEVARRHLERIQGSLRLAEVERDTAKADSARAKQRSIELATAIEQMKAEAESEHKRLAQQISANATGRIEEYKKRLGLNLSRLVVDLPGRDTSVTAELGKILLLQFHQFLDALRQEGIEMRTGAR